MRHHPFTSTAIRPVSAVTFDRTFFGRRAEASIRMAARYFDGDAWHEQQRSGFGYTLNSLDCCLVHFSDGSYGTTAPDHLGAALATYDITLAD